MEYEQMSISYSLSNIFINVVYVRMSFCILRFGSRTLDMLCGSCCVNVLFVLVFGIVSFGCRSLYFICGSNVLNDCLGIFFDVELWMSICGSHLLILFCRSCFFIFVFGIVFFGTRTLVFL